MKMLEQNMIYKLLRRLFGILVLTLVLFLILCYLKSDSIYRETWNDERILKLDWNQYSTDFKTITLSEMTSEKANLYAVKLTMHQHFKDRKVSMVYWHFFGIITSIYFKYFVSNEQALSIIINQTNFAHSTIGFPEGAKYFFDKDIKNINYSESALLYTIQLSPSYFNPILHADRARFQRNEILDKLRNKGVNEEVIKKSKKEPIFLSRKYLQLKQ